MVVNYNNFTISAKQFIRMNTAETNISLNQTSNGFHLQRDEFCADEDS